MKRIIILLTVLLLQACKPGTTTGATQTAMFETEVAEVVSTSMSSALTTAPPPSPTPDYSITSLPIETTTPLVTVTPTSYLDEIPVGKLLYTATPTIIVSNACGSGPCPTIDPSAGPCGNVPCSETRLEEGACGGVPCASVPDEGPCGDKPCANEGPRDGPCGSEPCKKDNQATNDNGSGPCGNEACSTGQPVEGPCGVNPCELTAPSSSP